MEERLAIAGTGAIACGLAATAARHGEVLLLARSAASADRARASVGSICGRLSGAVNARHVRVETDLEALAGASFLVEAIVEDAAAKAELLARLAGVAARDALLATTTSSLSVAELAAASGIPERFAALHVFNPVPRMKLVELAFPAEARQRDPPARARAVRGAGQDARSRCPTRRGSWSTACSSPTCSAPSS